MMYWFDRLIFDPKKMKAMVMLIISYLFWIGYVVFKLVQDDHLVEDMFVHYEKLTYQLFISIVPLWMGWLLLDLSHPSEKMFVTLGYPHLVWDLKWLYVTLISALTIMFFYFSWWLIPRVFVPRLSFIINPIEPIHLWLDLLILYLISSCLISDKIKTLSLLSPLGYLIFQLFMQDHVSQRLYVILPLYQEKITTYEVALTYKLWYIGLGFIIVRHFFGKTARNG